MPQFTNSPCYSEMLPLCFMWSRGKWNRTSWGNQLYGSDRCHDYTSPLCTVSFFGDALSESLLLILTVSEFNWTIERFWYFTLFREPYSYFMASCRFMISNCPCSSLKEVYAEPRSFNSNNMICDNDWIIRHINQQYTVTNWSLRYFSHGHNLVDITHHWYICRYWQYHLYVIYIIVLHEHVFTDWSLNYPTTMVIVHWVTVYYPNAFIKHATN